MDCICIGEFERSSLKLRDDLKLLEALKKDNERLRKENDELRALPDALDYLEAKQNFTESIDKIG